MRFLSVLLTILYLSVALSVETRSASQAWLDNSEAQVNHSQSLLNQHNTTIVDAETPKDPETKKPLLLQKTTGLLVLGLGSGVYYAPEQLPRRSSLLNAAPRAPPVLA